jgi:two-component system response regulator HydG
MLPLRQRPEDIPLLAQHFLLLHRDKVGKSVEGFTPLALDALTKYSYPGNIRELENKVHHALVLCTGETIDINDLPHLEVDKPATREIDLGKKFRELKRDVVEDFENQYTIKILEAHGGNLAAAARQGGIDRKNLWAMAKKYDIPVNAIRARTRDEND